MEAGAHLNKAVIVSGIIEKIGDQKTYLILKDDQGKLLVDLTNYYDLPLAQELQEGEALKVVGFVKSGRKGLFHVAAHAVKKTKRPMARISQRLP